MRDPKWKHVRLTTATKAFDPLRAPLGARGDLHYRLCAAVADSLPPPTVSAQLRQAHYRCLVSLRSCCRQTLWVNKMEVVISRSSRAGKKFEARSRGKSVHFGATGYEDFTQHGYKQRRANYLSRHGNQNWTKKNLMSSVFMSRWLLWEEQNEICRSLFKQQALGRDFQASIANRMSFMSIGGINRLGYS